MFSIGVDIGGMSIKAGVVDRDGCILASDRIRTRADELTQEEIIENTASLIRRVVRQADRSMEDIDVIGVGSPGTPNNETGTLIFSGNLPFRDLPIRALLGTVLDKPIYLGNDANVAALAESRIGAGHGCTSAVLITLGTGVGGGVILNDRVYSGFNDAGSELGHMVICMDGEPCTCGRQGCFEAYASAAALIRQTEQAMAEYPDSLLYEETTDEGRVTGRTAFNAMKRGDAVAIGVVERYIRYIGEGLANIINVLMPEMIILGGGISNEGDHFLQRVKKQRLSAPSSMET